MRTPVASKIALAIAAALGTEAHKGHKRMSVGDPLDTCLRSWLKGSVDTNACKTAAPPLQ